MKLKLKVDQTTTASELIILGAFFESLALNREGHVVSTGADVEPKITTPTDPAELQEPETVVVPPAAGEEAPKRKRRTKAEIEAERLAEENSKVAAAEAEAQASNEAGLAEAQVEAGNVETPAPTPDVQPPVTPPSETASTEPASASPSEGGKTYTHAEVQALAVDTARRYGPEKVKALIATYPNAAKIAELDEGDLAGFVAKLQAISA